jgi:hypothetical protein
LLIYGFINTEIHFIKNIWRITMNNIRKAVVTGELAVTLFGGGMAFASGTGFTDTGWWSNVAQWAKDRGLMTGTGNGIFGGDESLTRGQMAQVLYNLTDKGMLNDPTKESARGKEINSLRDENTGLQQQLTDLQKQVTDLQVKLGNVSPK